MRSSVGKSEGDGLLRRFVALGGMQLAVRLLRVATVLVAARILGAEAYGIAAVVLAVNECFHVLSHGTLGNRLVQAEDHELPLLARSAYWMSWALSAGLWAAQSLAALWMARHEGTPAAAAPIAVLALAYWVLPMGTVATALILRQGRTDVIARVEVAQGGTEAMLTLVLCLIGADYWSLVLPKVLTAPLWCWMVRRAQPWPAPRAVSFRGAGAILRTGLPAAVSDAAQSLRFPIVNLATGTLLGMEAAGVLAFGLNAGLGIGLSLLRSLGTVLYVQFARQVRDQGEEINLRRGWGVAVWALGPLSLLQALLAPIYVPVLFGERWVEAGAVWLVAVFSLATVPLALIAALTQALRACGATRADVVINWLVTGAVAVSAVLVLREGVTAVAITVLIVIWTIALGLVAWGPRPRGPGSPNASQDALHNANPLPGDVAMRS